MSDKKIPVYLLSGFLGSGKTTLLLRMLNYCTENNLTPAIVLNELGEQNIERHLFEDEKLIELLNGCICCTIQEDLTKELSRFIDQQRELKEPIDLIIIEGTGVANPLDVIDAVTHPSLISALQLYSIIGLVDTSQYLDYQSIFTSSKEVRTLLKQQIEHSTVLILNKTDLVTERTLKKVKNKMDQIRLPEAVVLEATQADINVKDLFQTRISDGHDHHSHGHHSHGHHSHDHHSHDHHSHDHHSHDHHSHGHPHDHNDEHGHHHPHPFQTMTIHVPDSLDRIALDRWLQYLPEEVVRAKGIVRLQEAPGRFEFQFSSKQLVLQRINQNRDAGNESCIILIGHALDSDKIKESFESTFSRKESF